MNSVFLVVTACAGLYAAHAAVPASELRQNYQSIIERNPFGLRPPPEPKKPEPPPEKKPEVDYFLTGITSVGHPDIPRQAYIMTREQGQKEPNYYSLSESKPGQELEVDGIKVLNIDPEKGEVKVTTPHGEMLLSFKTHGVEPPGAAPVAGVPGAAGRPGAVPPPPGSPARAYARPLPGRGGPSVTPGGNAYNRTTIPPRTVRTRGPSSRASIRTPGADSPPPLNGNQPEQDAPEPIDPALQYLNLRLQEEAARQQGIEFPPVPPIQ